MDYPALIKRIRVELLVAQEELASMLGVTLIDDIWRGRARVGHGLVCQAKESWLKKVSGLDELQQRVCKEPYCCWATE